MQRTPVLVWIQGSKAMKRHHVLITPTRITHEISSYQDVSKH